MSEILDPQVEPQTQNTVVPAEPAVTNLVTSVPESNVVVNNTATFSSLTSVETITNTEPVTQNVVVSDPTIVTTHNVVTDNSNVMSSSSTQFVLASMPSTLINGALSSIDSVIIEAKNTLDAEILAAQNKAKNAIASSVALAKKVISEIEGWIETAPGNIQVIESTIIKDTNTVVNIVQNVKTDTNKIVSNTVTGVKTVSNDTAKVTTTIVTDAEDVGVFIKDAAEDAYHGGKTAVVVSEDVLSKLGDFWKKL